MRVTNVVVTTGQLIPTFVKLLLFDLAPSFAPEDIFSARTTTKLDCFACIRQRFRGAAHFCVIGASCLTLRGPFWCMVAWALLITLPCMHGSIRGFAGTAPLSCSMEVVHAASTGMAKYF